MNPGGTPVTVIAHSTALTQRHALHQSECIWTEKNCYADLWIEVLHALGRDPVAMLPFVVTADFEGDQWTFFKPSHDDIRHLYGVKVHELTVWRPLHEHLLEHLNAGRLVSIEVDAFWLPDTAGTDYRHKHSKTTVAFNHVDVDSLKVGYFHNAGYFEAEGDDARELLQLAPRTPDHLPLFAELISVVSPGIPPEGLRARSLGLMRQQLQWLPSSNPVPRFAQRFAHDLAHIQASGMAQYHVWAFAGIRQWGAAFELAAAWLDWMGDALGPERVRARDAFSQLSLDAKTLILKGARAVASRKPFDPVAQLASSAALWQDALDALIQAVANAPDALPTA